MEKTEQRKKAENIIISLTDYIEESTEHDDSIITEELVSRIERILVVLKEKQKWGRRVKITTLDNAPYPYDSIDLKVGQEGVLIAVEDEHALVKFDNFNNGHGAIGYYVQNKMPYDVDDTSHWWIPVELIEEIKEDKAR